MSVKFHISDDGVARKCTAGSGKSARGCQYGFSENEHYATKEEATAAYEKNNSSKLFSNSLSKKSLRRKKIFKGFRKAVLVGGTVAAAFSVTGCNDITSSHTTFGDGVTHEDVQENIEDGIDDAKQKWDDSGIQDKIIDGISDYGSSGLGDTLSNLGGDLGSSLSGLGEGSNSNVDPNGVYLQGQSLIPTIDEVNSAKEILGTIEITEENGGISYNRDSDYGQFKNNVVSQMEQRDITNGVFNDKGRAIDGTFVDPYTGETIQIVKGDRNDTNVDHIVPLKEVQRSGGDRLSQSQRESIANDPANLQIVGGSVNKSKSDKDASKFLPSYEPAVCKYSIQVIKVKSNYNLTMDSQEANTLRNVLDTRCAT